MALALALFLTLLPIVSLTPASQTGAPASPDARFTSIDGSSLSDRVDRAVSRGRATDGASHFWVAFGFDVRPGVAVDLEVRSTSGRVVQYEGFSLDTNPKLETRNLAVFMLYEKSTARPDRVEVYNLDRKRGYDGYPVMWTGRAASDESLKLLGDLLASQPSGWVAERTVAAIALHADARAAGMLEGIARSSPYDGARSAALRWLGIVSDDVSFLAGFVRDAKESLDLRKEAIMAIGISSAGNSVSQLSALFAEATNRELRESIVDAVGIHSGRDDSDASIDFLIRVVDGEHDVALRKKAIFWLGQKAGSRSLSALEDEVESPEEEMQAQAVFAISQRDKDEAVPILIRLARTHRSPVVKRQAIFWLGQIDDERVVPFLKELLGK
ncbi:MAG TPA: HEAT repeat domain-containing protein [Blastocatellia bacterium]|nr:HEAT repeat domain-containing protein [Blastocatellia bacterium]